MFRRFFRKKRKDPQIEKKRDPEQETPKEQVEVGTCIHTENEHFYLRNHLLQINQYYLIAFKPLQYWWEMYNYAICFCIYTLLKVGHKYAYGVNDIYIPRTMNLSTSTVRAAIIPPSLPVTQAQPQS